MLEPTLTEEQIKLRLEDLGNLLGKHTNVLSHNMLAMKFDARHQRAKLRFGGGQAHYLTFRIASDVQFNESVATVNARVDLGLGDRTVSFELPSFEMAPVEFRGDYGVELRLPLFKRAF
jgi:hypothetical protein